MSHNTLDGFNPMEIGELCYKPCRLLWNAMRSCENSIVMSEEKAGPSYLGLTTSLCREKAGRCKGVKHHLTGVSDAAGSHKTRHRTDQPDL